MTKRYFYDCPIKAAYMVRYHDLKIRGPARMPTGAIGTSTRPMPVWILARAIEAAEKGQAPDDARYYVSDGSLCLLEPRPLDTLQSKAYKGAIAIALDLDHIRNLSLSSASHMVIQRNGLAFMWPESEDA